MAFLDFIFGRRYRDENDFFGTMHFFEVKEEPYKIYFECRRHFKLAGKSAKGKNI